MRFDSFDALVYMDGHGIYVWTTYLVALIIFLMLAIYPMLQKRSLLKKIKRQNRPAKVNSRFREPT
jgi:heme exporter protein D